MNTNYFWLIEAVVGVLALVGLQYGIKKILFKAGKNGEGWRRRIGTVFQPPLSVLIWSLIALYLVDVFGQRFGLGIALEYLGALRKTAVIGCFGWLFFRWKNEIETILLTDYSSRVDRTTVQIVGRLATLLIGVITALIVMQAFGVNVVPLLAFGSIGAAALGFASKDVMANFCSGIMLQITRPFVRGDQIFLPEKHLEGHIEEIGWFRTSIRDNEKRAVYLPNNFFSTMLVINVSRMTHRRVKQTIKVPLDASQRITEAVPKIHEALSQMKGIDTHLPVHVFLKSFGDYACEIEVEAFSSVLNIEAFNRFQQEVLLKVKGVLAEMDIELAIPKTLWTQTF